MTAVPDPLPTVGPVLAPRPHQLEAIDRLTTTLDIHGRAQMVAACGTGKTLIGRWTAAGLAPATVLVVVPSLTLLAQTLTEWRRAGGPWQFESLVCCSDPSTAAGAAERAEGEGWDPAEPYWARHRARVSTDPFVVSSHLERSRDDHPLVVFSTYHSLPVVEEAARQAGARFDLAIFDEAHHLAGRARESWRHCLADEHLPITRRLFMTATPVDVDTTSPREASMSDRTLFGPVAFRMTFPEAIAAGLLVDYEVLVIDTGDASASAGRRVDPLAALPAIARRGATRVLSFHGRVRKAQGFAAAADQLELPDGRHVAASWVSGRSRTEERVQRLAQLADPPEGALALLSNARCLSEGVDIPAVDAVLFCDPKDSTVDTVQAIGRALRSAPGKRKGLIVVPVTLDGRVDLDTSLASGPFAGVWRVLRALRDVDERFSADVSLDCRQAARRGTPSGDRRLGPVTFELPADIDLDELTARLVDTIATGWDRFYGLLQAYADAHGSVLDLPAKHETPCGASLGLWADRQRSAYAKGMLSAEHVRALAQVPGWAWDGTAAAWLHQHAIVRAIATADGELDLEGPQADRRVPDPRGRGRKSLLLGQWCARQRLAHRAGTLTDRQRTLLAEIPGWSLAQLTPADAGMVDLLGEYVAWKHDANPAYDVVEDDRPLGVWVDQIRRRRAADQLSRVLQDEVDVVTPAPSSPGALEWKTREARWLLAYDALRQFAARESTCRIPGGHVETLDDVHGLRQHPVPLADWARRQRHLHRHGDLHPACAAALDSVSGWLWEVPLRAGDRPVLDGVEHGERTAYVKGCRCDPCTDANHQRQADRDARAAAGQSTTDLVEATRARAHLRILEGRGASQKGMARAADLNTKTITQILTGETKRILPETETTILALNLDRVRATAAAGTLIPAGPTWVQLDSLIDRGWPRAWIARELGLGNALQLPRTQITAGNAAKVAQLYGRVGLLKAPPRRHRHSLPRLDEVLACAAGSVAEAAS